MTVFPGRLNWCGDKASAKDYGSTFTFRCLRYILPSLLAAFVVNLSRYTKSLCNSVNIWTAGDRNGSDSIISALMDALRPILSFKILIFFFLHIFQKVLKLKSHHITLNYWYHLRKEETPLRVWIRAQGLEKVFATQHLFSFIPHKIESLDTRSFYKKQNYGMKGRINQIFDVVSIKYGVCIIWYGNQNVCRCFGFWDSEGKICFNFEVCNILVLGFSRRRRPEFASTSQNVARAT